MKLRSKLIFRTVTLVALLIGLFGSILIQSAFEMQLSREKDALESRSVQLVQSIEAAAVNYALQSIALTDELISGVLSRMDSTAALYAPDGALITGEKFSVFPEDGLLLSGRRLYLQCPVLLSGQKYRLLTQSDLSSLYESRKQLLTAYILIYCLLMLLFSSALILTARSLTRPLEQLTQISARLTAGQSEVRAQLGDTFETRELAISFNQMADTLTSQIDRQGRFIADLTHEIKTPLTAIIGHADLIRSGRIKDDAIQLAAHSIFKEGQRLNALSTRLIDLILLENDQGELIPTHIRPIIEETVELLRPSAHERGVELSIVCADAVVSCDRTLFSSLLSNLIDNALKSGASQVRVEGSLSCDVFALCISDDGCGMDQTSLQRITEPFYRVDKSRSRAQGGAGIGLALCAQIARLHHAILSFESAPGEGTRATISMLGKEASDHAEA